MISDYLTYMLSGPIETGAYPVKLFGQICELCSNTASSSVAFIDILLHFLIASVFVTKLLSFMVYIFGSRVKFNRYSITSFLICARFLVEMNERVDNIHCEMAVR